MGIWMHIHSITIINVAPDLGELAEVQGKVWVQMISIRYPCGHINFQTASCLHGMHEEGV